MNDLTVVIPVHNEKEEIVEALYDSVTSLGAECIIVDDGDTMALNCPSITYKEHKGYGYAIKFGIQHAKNPIICTADGDNQHSVADIKKMYTVYKLITDCKMLVGCRWNLNEVWYRWIGRKVINFIASLWAKHYLIDLNSGMRVFDRELAINYSSILCDTFSFTTSLTMCMVTDDYKVAWFPIDVKPRTYGKSKVRLFSDAIVTLKYIFWIGFALRTRKLRAWLRGR